MTAIIRIAINAAALLVAVALVPGIRFQFGESWWKLALVALLLAVLNTYLKPILKLAALPVSMLTLGLAGLAVNTGVILLLAVASSQLSLEFSIRGWPHSAFTLEVLWSAFLASIVISVVSLALELAFGQRKILGIRV